MAITVIKLGTSTLTDNTSKLSRSRMVDLVRQICILRDRGIDVVLVSSGAIAAGRETLGDPTLTKSIPAKQMLSAVGQPRLMDLWGQFFSIYEVFTAQILLTRADLSERNRFLNARNTLWALLKQGVIPIINENDSVATEEIRVGDNDNLSALVANLIHADRLILLTDQDGLFAEDPRINPEAKLISRIESPELPQEILKAAGGSGSRLGVGGMRTKIEAAELARRAGASVTIARGSLKDVLLRIESGETIGTLFTPTASPPESFKRFILSGAVTGDISIDSGAAVAIQQNGSLLPSGILKIEGNFDRGGVVRVLNSKNAEVARGLVNYDFRDCQKILGLQSGQIEPLLGYYYGDEVIHRDNLILMKKN